MVDDNPHWAWVNYDDGQVIELNATYDDVLKSNPFFTNYASRIANSILEDAGIKIHVEWGKYGARIDRLSNRYFHEKELEQAAELITNHESWKALKLSTKIATYGKQTEE